MNKVAKRSGVVLVLLALLIGGFVFFLVEYAMKSHQWVIETGSPHVYEEEKFAGGVVIDRSGLLLLDMSKEGWQYSSNESIRQSMLHWVGDREGNILVPAVPNYYGEVVRYDFFNGLYAYGGIQKDGGVVQLTLSAKLQTVALEALGKYKGTVAVYNYETGEILCAVTTPTYDPDNVPDIAGDPVRYEGAYMNRFLQSAYPPGSIFKTVTLAAALEEIEGVEDRTFTCSGSWGDGEFAVTCENVHGTQTLKDAFCNSCNCAFAELSQMLGGETLLQYVEQFGIVDAVIFDGVRTEDGNFELAPNDIRLAWSAIGQDTDLINPCTFMTFMGAIAGGGSGINPYVVSSANDGENGYQAKTVETDRIMSKETAETVKAYMQNNVVSKYGEENFPGLTVCAKTGTAEVDGDRESYAMFSGFVADEEYPLAFIICVEEGGYGRHTCVPIASKVLSACKDILDQE